MKVYLDHHATTPVDPAVLEAMLPFFREQFGNAASVSHSYGLTAKAAVERARETLAKGIGAEADEIIFTSGATESDNLALTGVARHALQDGRNHIVTAVTEHKAVLDTAKALEKEGIQTTTLAVNPDGFIDLDQLERAITGKTCLVSIMAANNEIGTLQPIAEIADLCHRKNVYFHTDAAQIYGVGSNVDLMSLSAHKMYGPKGVGALFVRKNKPRVKLEAILHGGGHERGFRSGTLNVPGIVGFGKAAELSLLEDKKRIAGLRDRLWKGIQDRLDGIRLNGSMKNRHPGNLNVSFEHVEGEALTNYLNERGVAVSTGSACSSAVLEPSHVLKAIGLNEPQVFSSIRFGVGRENTEEEIDYALEALVAAVKKLRAMSPFVESQ